MTMTRFATLCDHCGARSEEYRAWPTCRECFDDICPACAAPGTLREADGATDSVKGDSVLCCRCDISREEEVPHVAS